MSTGSDIEYQYQARRRRQDALDEQEAEEVMVMVDLEQLREALTVKEYPRYQWGETRETCSWEGCGYLVQSWGDKRSLPHGDGCPLGDGDA